MIDAINIGPVSIAIDADCDEFQNYEDGIFDGGTCGGSSVKDLDHGVLLTGYSVSVTKWNTTNGSVIQSCILIVIPGCHSVMYIDCYSGLSSL